VIRTLMTMLAMAILLGVSPVSPAVVSPARAATEDTRPYDQKLMRLAELLGALHYLRALCGADDGQKWREATSELIRSEGTSALRKATIARRFNRGYRGYSRTYRQCTASAKTTISRFIVEAVTISDELLKLAK
jgi:uncharacterized protein (TIGR02301 family)